MDLFLLVMATWPAGPCKVRPAYHSSCNIVDESSFTGVLLLNACLTVREREANSHEGKVRGSHISWYYPVWCLCVVYSLPTAVCATL